MRIRSAYVPCLALLLACCYDTAAGQRRRGTSARRGATTNAPAPAAPKTARGPAWSITTQPFNEDSQATTLVSLQPMPTAAAAGSGQSPLSFGVNFAYEGDSTADFKNVTLSFFARGKACRIALEPAIVMNLDNRPLTLPYRPQGKGADGVFWVESVEEGGDCAETVVTYISPATLAKIASARSATGRIGEEAFRMTADNLAALRALLAQLRLPQLRNTAPQPVRPRPRR